VLLGERRADEAPVAFRPGFLSSSLSRARYGASSAADLLDHPEAPT